MKRRPAVTLMEVLIAMFIMAIGMLALLALFPVGAVSMAQALKDDRCAYASTVSENVAIAMDVRHDLVVTGTIALPTGFASPLALASGLVYVDPYGWQQTLATLGGLIPRVSPSYVGGSQPLADRYFSLQDDISFAQSGLPDSTTGVIDRGRRYTYAYLLQRMPSLGQQLGKDPFSISSYTVHLYTVVYNGRPVNSLATTPTEWPSTPTVFPPPPPAPTPPPPTHGLQLAVPTTTARRGGWILDLGGVVFVVQANGTITPTPSPYGGTFYRVTNIQEAAGTTILETQQNMQLLPGQINMNILIMDYVAEVFDKGFGWQQ